MIYRFTFLIWLCCFLSSVQSQIAYKESALGHIIINAQIDGKSKKLIFDTGFSFTTIFLDELPTEATNLGTDAKGNKVFGSFSEKKQLRIKPLKIKGKMPFLQLEKPKSQIWEDMDVDGILGANVINMYDWHIDFENKTLHIVRRRDLKKMKGKDFFSFNMINRKHQIIYEFPNQKPDTLLVDTGYNGIASLSQDKALQSNCTPHSYRIGFTEVVSGYTQRDTSVLKTCDINIGNFAVTSLPIVFRGKKEQSKIGLDFIRPFKHFYIINSLKKYLVPSQEQHTFEYPNFKSYRGKVMAENIKEISPNKELKLGQSSNSVEVKILKYPITNYFYKKE